MVVLADRDFNGFALWKQASGTGADLVWRAKNNVTPRLIETFEDGSWLGELRANNTELNTEHVVARVVDYDIDDGRGTPAGPFRLFTSLVDPDEVTATDLAVAYAQRWEIESVFDELKTHQRGSKMVLRSKSPALVQQEIWGHLCCHHAIRTLMFEAADHAHTTTQWCGESALDRADHDTELRRRSAQRQVVVSVGEAELGREMTRRDECFERHQVEPSARVDELTHRPSQHPERDQFDGVREVDDRADHLGRDRIVNSSQPPRHRPDHRLVGEGSTESVVPEPGRGDRRARWTECGWFVVEEDAQEHVVVDEDDAQASSGSSAATAAASAA